jgi:regulatory protein
MKIKNVAVRRSKAEIVFENGERITVSKVVWEKTPYVAGAEINENELKNLIEQDEIFSIKATSLRILARREHSKSELRSKLLQRGFSKKNIDLVIDILEREKFLDDGRFTEIFVRSNMENRKKSPRAIRYELSKKGIDNSLIDKYLTEISEDDVYRNALELATKKLRLLSKKKDAEKKLFAIKNHLAYRAYSNEIVNRVLTEIKERLGA